MNTQSRGPLKGAGSCGLYRSWYRDEEQWLNAVDQNVADTANTESNPFEAPNLSMNDTLNRIGLNPLNGANGVNGTKGSGGGMESENASSSQFAASSVVIGGLSEVVICGICREEFCKTNKEYNAQRDDWMLTNSCYADGSTSSQYPRGKVPDKAIVHRTCFEAEKRGKGGDEEDEALRPKLHNPSSTISKIEDQLNENETKKKRGAASKGTKRRRKRMDRERNAMNHLFGASDDEEDDDEDDDEDEEEQNGNGNVDGARSAVNVPANRMSKKRRLNGVAAIDDDLDDDDDDDLRGMAIDELDDEISKPITITVPAAAATSDVAADDSADIKNGNVEEKDSAKIDNLDADEDPVLDLDEEELGDLQNIDDEDLEDDDEEEIVLFDPSAMSQGFY